MFRYVCTGWEGGEAGVVTDTWGFNLRRFTDQLMLLQNYPRYILEYPVPSTQTLVLVTIYTGRILHYHRQF